jgi:serine/threonine protein phosphatase PrpC
MSFEIDIGYSSQRGRRAVNEDFGGVVQGNDPAAGWIAAVADGVSSGGAGLEAAQCTVMSLLADYHATPATWQTSVALDRLIQAQNAWLASHNRRRPPTGQDGAPHNDGAGPPALTTLTALVLRGQTASVAHVGDTRAWLLREGQALQQLTQDHAYPEPDRRSQLTRAVGLDDGVRVDHLDVSAQPGDMYLLTSDGVHGHLKPAQLAACLRLPSAQAACDAMTTQAITAGSTDNCTALLLRVLRLDARQLGDEAGLMRRLPVVPLLKAGQVYDGYRIQALVADNGQHRLYQAVDVASGEAVALKALHPARASDDEERGMLAHEAWLGRQLQPASGAGNAGIVADHALVRTRVHSTEPAGLYIAFDWHAGRTMEQLMASSEAPPPAPADVVACGLAMTQALGRLHRLGVVHRDVKPGNLHRGDDGRWRLIDLGSALSGAASAAQRALHAGTPSYMNPEQWEDGGTATPGSDLFALGASLYQWLTGRLPYGEIEPYQLGRFRRDPPSASRLRPDVPIWLDHVLAKAVARDPSHRFETAQEFELALERGAARPVQPPGSTPLLKRDPRTLWQLALAVSLLLNALLIVWLMFLPR